MKVQQTKISKTYNDFELYKLKLHMKIDDDLTIDPESIEELWQDAIDHIEKDINKDVAYTLNEYIFYDFAGSKIIVDEGNFQTISAITYTDNNNTVHIITDYSLIFNSLTFRITLNQEINAKELHIKFYSGYPQDKMDKSIRRAARIICNDLRNWEDASYTVQQSNKSDIIERLLNPLRKSHFIDYSCYYKY